MEPVVIETKKTLKLYDDPTKIEVGVDEVARGCLFGRVYAAAVIWGKEDIPLPPKMKITDSKKMTKKQREKAAEFIKEHAVAYAIEYRDEKYIDEYNILNASISAMIDAILKLPVEPEIILVDGIHFKQFINGSGNWVSYKCIPGGDAEYFSIACASILAKVEHDKYIEELCATEPELNEKYGLVSNMGYGTAKHLAGIKQHGISPYHRLSFSPCKPLQSENHP